MFGGEVLTVVQIAVFALLFVFYAFVVLHCCVVSA